MSNDYEALVGQATVDERVVGLVLTGSRAAEVLARPGSDWDVRLIVREAVDYSAARGETVEVAVVALSDFEASAELGSPDEWDRYSYVHAVVVLDKLDGRIAELVARKATLSAADAHELGRRALDAYINAYYRSAKNLALGLADESHLDAAESVSPFLTSLFAMNGRIRSTSICAGSSRTVGSRGAAGMPTLSSRSFGGSSRAAISSLSSGSFARRRRWREGGASARPSTAGSRTSPGSGVLVESIGGTMTLNDMTTVSESTTERYERDGYLVIPEALASREVDALRVEALRICRGDLGAIAGLESVSPDEPDDAVVRRYICIHDPHKLSAVMLKTMAHPAIVDVLTQVIGPDVKSMQSMLFIKGEGKPGQAWHQDEYFIPTRDRSLTGAWIALDDATVENGCLWVLPGSHRPGVLYPDREHDDERFDCAVEAYDFPYADDEAIPVEIPSGAALIFNGYLLHRSLPNTGKHGLRRALVNHYMSAQSLLPWYQPPPDVDVGKWDYRDIVMVAGNDPYAYKGTVDQTMTHVRPDRDGGCDR